VLTSYQDQISNVSAWAAAGARLGVTHPDPRAWDIATNGASSVTVRYDVAGTDAGYGFFGAHLDANHGFINPAALCMYPAGRTREPVSISFHLPAGWGIATALDTNPGGGGYVAADYDELVDSPFELGRFRRIDFEAGGIPMFVTFTYDGEMRMDAERVTQDLKKIAEAEFAIFGGPPMKRYFWNMHLKPGRFSGGLEHGSGTTLNIDDSRDLGLLRLAAHEFFHLWNVERIRPKLLGPFDYTGPQRVKGLWFVEGVTSYYADLVLYRAGFAEAGWLLRMVLDEMSRLRSSSDRKRYTVEEASLKAWEGASLGYGNLSYYNKGYLIALLLDLSIRTRTGGQKSLDDVMRYLFERYCRPKPGYDENGILQAINAVSGQDFTELYDQMVRSTEELPCAEVYRAAGLDYRAGGTIPNPGFKADVAGDRAYPRVGRLDATGTGPDMGLRAGDYILQVNGEDARGRTEPLAGIEPGETFTMVVSRGGKRITLTGTLGSHTVWHETLELAAQRSALQEKVISGWLAR
jgi:predicted metalloprotease with PDZ domain